MLVTVVEVTGEREEPADSFSVLHREEDDYR